jgi:hypothetical protein
MRLPTLCLALVLLAEPAIAQPPPADPADPRARITEAERAARRAARNKLRDEVMDQMRTMRMWKLTKDLKLDQAAAARVFPVLAQFDERGKEIFRERWGLAREVQDQIRSEKPDEARLHKLIDKLQENQRRRNALDEERFTALRQALTPVQQARLLLLLPRIDDEFRQRIREAIRAQKTGQSLRPEANTLQSPF